MGRWEPNARGRLEQAALELFVERGFEQTTVAEIAQRAGLTERTFFRHFTDKREVLFAGGSALQELLVTGVAQAPDGTAPLDAVSASLQAAAPMLQQRGDYPSQRQAVIAANPELQERELIKMAGLAAAMAVALRDRGAPAGGQSRGRGRHRGLPGRVRALDRRGLPAPTWQNSSVTPWTSSRP